jgi:50S ribosomal subunit-associated GTPase HflX
VIATKEKPKEAKLCELMVKTGKHTKSASDLGTNLGTRGSGASQADLQKRKISVRDISQGAE